MISFIGVGDLETFMEVSAGALNADLAELAVAASQQKIREYLDQEITYHANEVAYLDGGGRRKIRLPQRPVRAVDLVEERTGTATFSTLASENYFLRRSILIRVDGYIWEAGEANLRVTYDHGYDVGVMDSDPSTEQIFVPADISLVALSLSRRMYENMGEEEESLGEVKQETIGSYSYTLSSAAEKAAGVNMVFAEKEVLNAYKVKGAG